MTGAATKSELAKAIADVRDSQLATLLTLTIGLAAEKHPEELRKAIGRVFDLSGVEESTRRAGLVLAQVQRDIIEARLDLQLLRQEISELDKQLDGCRMKP